MYDSRNDTLKHRAMVCSFLALIRYKLTERGLLHDESKLHPPEKEAFDIVVSKLKDMEYGSEEYRASLQSIKPALVHHNDNNAHHPEYWPNGIEDMSLIDLIEMLADWKAATLRMKQKGDISKSLEINKERFNIPEPIYQILKTTLKQLNW